MKANNLRNSTKPPPAPTVKLHLAAIDIPPRLTFLNDLRSRPAFQGAAMLDLIIADYRRALAKARGTDVAASAKPGASA